MDESDPVQMSSPDIQDTESISENGPTVNNSPAEQEVNPNTIVNENACNNAIDVLPTGDENTDVTADPEQNPVKKEKRKVFFPGDERIVKSYLEPPDPWKNVPQWRTEDLVRAYKTSCDKHGTKPLNKILQQLQCIENVGERYEILSLKGERLDLKQCESLEDIFKHVRFRCIDLEATHLDDEMAVAIFEMVEYYESACKLNISFNKAIGPRGWMSCSRLVRKTPCLTFIDARNCDLNDRVVPIFCRALRMGCFLQRLHLQNTNLAGRSLLILVAALKFNEMLKELFIGDNKFVPTDGVQIGNLLKYNHKLELLDLRNNHLQDAGVGHICDGLSEQCLDSGLCTLVLWNNQVTFQGMPAINKALTTTKYLETINLGHNPITNEGIHILKDGLLKAKGLLKLGLSGAKLSCEGAVALAEVIADNTKLVRMDLQENDIKTAGLMALSLALKVNENITRLDVDRAMKKESGIKDYAEQQKKLQKDITSIVDRNRELLHLREAEARLQEQRNQEHTKQLQEAAEDIARCLDDTGQYIPSGDGIHRPKLLFLPQSCPQHELDSPVIGHEFVLKSAPHSVSLTNPAGNDLLSPQYCPDPKATAKRIFSVTKVSSPTLALASPHADSACYTIPNLSSSMGESCVVNSPTSVHPPSAADYMDGGAASFPHLCTPLPSIQIHGTQPPVTVNMSCSPNSVQKSMEDETLVSYIQQIVNENNKDSEYVNVTIDGEDNELQAGKCNLDSNTEEGGEDVGLNIEDETELVDEECEVVVDTETRSNDCDNVATGTSVQIDKTAVHFAMKTSVPDAKVDSETKHAIVDSKADSIVEDIKKETKQMPVEVKKAITERANGDTNVGNQNPVADIVSKVGSDEIGDINKTSLYDNNKVEIPDGDNHKTSIVVTPTVVTPTEALDDLGDMAKVDLSKGLDNPASETNRFCDDGEDTTKGTDTQNTRLHSSENTDSKMDSKVLNITGNDHGDTKHSAIGGTEGAELDTTHAPTNCDSAKDTDSELNDGNEEVELKNDKVELPPLTDDAAITKNSNNNCGAHASQPDSDTGSSVETVLSNHSAVNCDSSVTSSAADSHPSAVNNNSSTSGSDVQTGAAAHSNCIEQDEEFVDCETSLKDEPFVNAGSGDVNTDNVASHNVRADDSKTSLDSEPWNPVNIDPAENIDSVVVCPTVKPDFHTNLSMNGLKQELASLIDEEGVSLANGAILQNKMCHTQDSGAEMATDKVETNEVGNAVS